MSNSPSRVNPMVIDSRQIPSDLAHVKRTWHEQLRCTCAIPHWSCNVISYLPLISTKTEFWFDAVVPDSNIESVGSYLYPSKRLLPWGGVSSYCNDYDAATSDKVCWVSNSWLEFWGSRHCYDSSLWLVDFCDAWTLKSAEATTAITVATTKDELIINYFAHRIEWMKTIITVTTHRAEN